MIRAAIAIASRITCSLCLAALVLATGCGRGDGGPAAAPAGGGNGKPPPPEVAVVTVTEQPVALQTELPGRVEALRTAQVRARVNGVVQKRLFEEGSRVKAGQKLFQIDAAPYRATLDSAQASLARAQANLTQAAAQAKRYEPLVQAHAVSQQEYVNAVAAQKQAQADVAAGRAAVQSARINLDYASVEAPIAGRIGRALVTEGALVSATEATQLALIQQIDSVYVNFTQSTTEVLRLRRAMQRDRLEPAAPRGDVAVHVLLEDGSVLPQAGTLLFTDLSVDPSSGQVTLRARVPNPQRLLLPGQYVRVRLAQAELPEGVLLPQQAVMHSDQGDSVWVVGADDKIAPRAVDLRGAHGTQWVIDSGLKPGERVVVEGFQKARPGAVVRAVAWQAPAQDGAAPDATPGNTKAAPQARHGASAPRAQDAASANAPLRAMAPRGASAVAPGFASAPSAPIPASSPAAN